MLAQKTHRSWDCAGETGVCDYLGLGGYFLMDSSDLKKKKGRRQKCPNNSSSRWMTQSKLEIVNVARLVLYRNLTVLVFLPFLCFGLRTPLHSFLRASKKLLFMCVISTDRYLIKN